MTNKKNTVAMKFKAKAKEFMPRQDELQKVGDHIDNVFEIEDIMFREQGEYIGGMAAVILRLI